MKLVISRGLGDNFIHFRKYSSGQDEYFPQGTLL